MLINILQGRQITEGKLKKESLVSLFDSPVAPKAGSLPMTAGAVDRIKEVQSGGWGHGVCRHSLVPLKDVPLRAALSPFWISILVQI